MSLFRFELRKLLLNKKNLILLLCLLALYSVVGLTSTMFLIGGNDSYRAYEEFGPMSILWTKKVERLCSFFEFLILLLLGCYVTNRTVYSFTVIPALNVFKNCSAGFR